MIQLVLLLGLLLLSVHGAEESKRRVLVIGGTQYIGRHTVEALLKSEKWRVSLLNRGQTPSPWAETGEIERYFKVDRYAERSEVSRVVADEGPWDAVVDFMAFDVHDALDVVDALKPKKPKAERKKTTRGSFFSRERKQKKGPVYVFISSDSVFMACDRALIEERRSEGDALLEGDCVRSHEVAALKARDEHGYEYGSGKLAIEEMLGEKNLTSLSLRLPDVIGPFDNLPGFLELFEDLQNGEPVVGSAVQGSKVKDHRASFVYAPDVGTAILALLTKMMTSAVPAVLHLASPERPTVAELVAMVSRAAGVKLPRFDDSEEAPIITVDVGPLDVSLALSTIPEWRPTPLAEAVKKTVAWFSEPKNSEYTANLIGGLREPDDDDDDDDDEEGDDDEEDEEDDDDDGDDDDDEEEEEEYGEESSHLHGEQDEEEL